MVTTKWQCFLWWVISFAAGGAVVFAQGGDAANLRLSALRERAKEVQSRTFGRAEECRSRPGLDCIAGEAGELRELLRDYSVWKLNEAGGDIDALRADFGTVDDGWVQERFSLMDRAEGNGRSKRGLGVPPHVFKELSSGREMIVVVHRFGSTALAFPSGIVIVQGFRKESGRYVFAAETGDSLFGIMDVDPVVKLESPVPGEMWLLISGQVAGFMGHLGRARIYGFDGDDFREIWKPEDRETLRLTVKGDEVRSTFLAPRIYRFGRDMQNCMDETVRLLPTGVVLARQANNGECGDPGRQR